MSDEYRPRPVSQEITRIRQLINRVKGNLDALPGNERARVDEAIAVVRRHRATHLGMPTIRRPLPSPRTQALA